jgi:hypothetical protein
MSHSSRPGYGGSSTNKKGVNTSSNRPGYGGSSTNKKGVNTSKYTPKTTNTGNDNSNNNTKKTIKELDSLIKKPKKTVAPPGEKGGGGTDSGNKVLSSTPFLAKKFVTKSTNPIKKWVYKGDTKGRNYYKNLPFKKALASENPFSKDYEGFKKGFQGKGKVSLPKYGLEGIKSLGGGTFGNISGGTTGSRYLFEKAAKLGRFFTPKANIALGVGIAAYDTTNWLMNNTKTGNKVKQGLYNVGVSLGDKLSNLSLMSSAKAGELDTNNLISPQQIDNNPRVNRFSYEPRNPNIINQDSTDIFAPQINETTPLNNLKLSEIVEGEIKEDTTPSQLEEIQFQIANTANSVAKNNLSPTAYTIVATSTAIANIALVKKEFKLDLNETSNIVANWKDGVSLMYNLKLGVN